MCDMNSTKDENSPIKFIIQASSKTLKRYIRPLCNNNQFSDINFLVGKDNQKQRMSAHKIILCSWSTVFEAMFCGSLATKSDEIEIPDVEPEAFINLLNFMYYNKVEVNPETVMSTLYAARKYNVLELEKQCVNFLKKNVDSENIFFLLNQARFYDLRKL
ncbi:BTB/POZ domain-containing protein 2-like, partial [Chrysoperla carnea]|uniref:BTB/POZ domain-containing protein 2-like n=1 Tax=Chrysoperla carnea TaxID=189513 RepID=UPI001D071510